MPALSDDQLQKMRELVPVSLEATTALLDHIDALTEQVKLLRAERDAAIRVRKQVEETLRQADAAHEETKRAFASRLAPQPPEAGEALPRAKPPEVYAAAVHTDDHPVFSVPCPKCRVDAGKHCHAHPMVCMVRLRSWKAAQPPEAGEPETFAALGAAVFNAIPPAPAAEACATCGQQFREYVGSPNRYCGCTEGTGTTPREGK